MGSRDLPDMLARSPRTAGPRAEGIHVRQIPPAHITTYTSTYIARLVEICMYVATAHVTIKCMTTTMQN